MKAAIILVVVLAWTHTAYAFQQDFPTGEEGYSVSYTVSDHPGSRSACVVSISRGLPIMALSIALFKDDEVTVNALWPQKIPDVAVGKQGTVRINSNFLVGSVSDAGSIPSSQYRYISLRLTEKEPTRGVGSALTDIILRGAQIEIIADGRHFPGVRVPSAEGMNAALLACLEHQARH